MRFNQLWFILVFAGLTTLAGCDNLPDGYDDYAKDGYGNDTSTGAGLLAGGEACVKHNDCESGICKLKDLSFDDKDVADGTCVSTDLVQYVNASADYCKSGRKSDGQGTKEAPYCEVLHGVGYGRYIHVKPGDYSYVPLDPKSQSSLLIVGPGRDAVAPARIKGVSSLGLASLWLDGVRLEKGFSSTAASCERGATLGLVRSVITSNNIGVSAVDCGKLWIDQSLILKNIHGVQIVNTISSDVGTKPDAGIYHVTNNLFLDNTTRNLSLKQARTLQTMDSVFALNTIVAKDPLLGDSKGWAIWGTFGAGLLSANTLLIRDTVIMGVKTLKGAPTVYCETENGGSTSPLNCNLQGVILDLNDKNDGMGSYNYSNDSLDRASFSLNSRKDFCIYPGDDAYVKATKGTRYSALIDYFGKTRNAGMVDAGYCQMRAK